MRHPPNLKVVGSNLSPKFTDDLNRNNNYISVRSFILTGAPPSQYPPRRMRSKNRLRQVFFLFADASATAASAVSRRNVSVSCR
jgi:hypothetical protein